MSATCSSMPRVDAFEAGQSHVHPLSFPRASSQRAIQVEGGADERQVGERLREVAERLAGLADLLGVEAEVVA